LLFPQRLRHFPVAFQGVPLFPVRTFARHQSYDLPVSATSQPIFPKSPAALLNHTRYRHSPIKTVFFVGWCVFCLRSTTDFFTPPVGSPAYKSDAFPSFFGRSLAFFCRIFLPRAIPNFSMLRTNYLSFHHVWPALFWQRQMFSCWYFLLTVAARDFVMAPMFYAKEFLNCLFFFLLDLLVRVTFFCFPFGRV